MRRALFLALLLCGCGTRVEERPPDPSTQATIEVKRYVDGQVRELVDACEALCGAAPEPDGDGWSGDERAAITTMRTSWKRARAAYERIEGAIAILFPHFDTSIDGRYEAEAELRRDDRPFDANGFIGMHAIERILWADAISTPAASFERALPGYVAPRRPANEAEARAFEGELCARLVSDVRTMRDELAPLALDPQTAWRGIVGSVEEQSEKVLLGTTGQDESRYAQYTLADMRANLAGGRAVLDAYAPLLRAHPEAARMRPEIDRRFGELERAYGEIRGDALPDVPAGFDPDAPSEAHLSTPYGRLFSLLNRASDPRADGSLAGVLIRAGEAMDIPPLGR